jgi:quinol monooxygenase YgiN
MSVGDVASQVNDEWRALAHVWDDTCEQWRDRARDHFERTHWQAIAEATADYLRAVESLDQVLEEALASTA